MESSAHGPPDAASQIRCARTRYTSYPTAAQFAPHVGERDYADWLALLPADQPLSLYVHVPFCDELCLYCGCHTAVARRPGPLAAYTAVLLREIAMVRARIGARLPVREIHWGGGTPTSLPASSLLEISAALGDAFELDTDLQISVEIDPRHLATEKLHALWAMGVNRASLGVQDLDPQVQQAVGRVQPVGMVQDCMTRLRAIGVKSINFDLIYGLPYQTEASLRSTVAQVVGMRPDRIAAFGYAHVPWMKKQQRLLPERALPDGYERYRQREAVAAELQAAGYRAIGLDHFALPEDALAQAAEQHNMHRNFQGYTADPAPVLLGLGASAIGYLPQGYVQNAASSADYMAAIRSGRLATARGAVLTAEDRLRRDVIEQVMCNGEVDLVATARAHAASADSLLGEAANLNDLARDGLVRVQEGHVQVTEAGRPFLRTVAAVFDAYHDKAATRHASAI